jgi:hypothetical protein
MTLVLLDELNYKRGYIQVYKKCYQISRSNDIGHFLLISVTDKKKSYDRQSFILAW